MVALLGVFAFSGEAATQQNGPDAGLRLLGTAASADSSGVAIIQRPNGATHFVERGWEIEGYTIAAILPAYLILRRADEELILELPVANAAVDAAIPLECAPGGRPGSVWGTDVYTTDSDVCTAAAHAGKISLERGGTVRYIIAAGRSSYDGSQRNGITTSDWGSYESSFIFR